MATAKAYTYDAIQKELTSGILKPVYILMGEENYFIDQLAEKIINTTLPNVDDRDFSMHTFFGTDKEMQMNHVVQAAQSFPMMGGKSLVIIREAQGCKDSLEQLTSYLQMPQEQTVLLIIYRGGTIDKRKKLIGAANSCGIVFNSEKVKEKNLPMFVSNWFRQENISIDAKSISLICESIGNDLTRLFTELDKLKTALPAGVGVTPPVVEKYIGISKDFNIFELRDALVKRDAFKAFQIINYFTKNEKAHPIQQLLPNLSSFYTQLMMAYYAPQKTADGIAQYLGANPYMVSFSILPAMRVYPPKKVFNIVEAIREADVRSKGGYGSRTPSADLLKELIAYILS